MTAVVERTSTVEPASRWNRPLLRISTFVAILVVLAWWLPVFLDTRSTSLMSRFLLLGLAAVGLDVLWGKAGLLSFGHAALFGLGCYGSGLLLAKLDLPLGALVPIVVGTAVPAFFGLVSGLLLFKVGVKGVYFGIITLLFALLFEQIASTWRGLTGGFNGLSVPRGLDIGPLELNEPAGMYRFVLVTVAVTYIAVRWFTSTPLGDAIQASRTNEVRAESLGYNVAYLRATALSVSGALAGLAGALYAPVEGFIYPNQLGLVASTSFIVWVAIGGRGTLYGALLGAVVVNVVQTELSDRFEEYWLLALGIFVVVVILYEPGGVVGAAQRLRSAVSRLTGGRRART
jgi:urea transport system permease protein